MTEESHHTKLNELMVATQIKLKHIYTATRAMIASSAVSDLTTWPFVRREKEEYTEGRIYQEGWVQLVVVPPPPPPPAQPQVWGVKAQVP
jgi:hypothetical protein